MSRRRKYRSIVEAHRAPANSRRGKVAQFIMFAMTSLSCTLIDQVLAAVLFEKLPLYTDLSDFVITLVASLVGRVTSLTLSYSINHKLIFSATDDNDQRVRMSKRESLPRFIALSGLILSISTLAVFCVYNLFGITKWKIKLVADFLLFFVNYSLQRKWVFNNDVQVRMRRRRK